MVEIIHSSDQQDASMSSTGCTDESCGTIAESSQIRMSLTAEIRANQQVDQRLCSELTELDQCQAPNKVHSLAPEMRPTRLFDQIAQLVFVLPLITPNDVIVGSNLSKSSTD